MIIIVVIISGGAIFVFASSPSLSLTGSTTVSSGQILQLHGRGFFPGGSVTFKLDNGQSLPLVRLPSPGTTANYGAAFSANAVNIVTPSQLVNPNTSVTVGVTGMFDARIRVTSQWRVGGHTIHATESLGSRSASLPVHVVSPPAKLVVSPSTLNYNIVARGRKVYLPLLLANNSRQRLNWTASTGGTSWLVVPTPRGVIQPGTLRQVIYVAADTSSLSLGSYTASLRITSNGGQSLIPVKLQVAQTQPNQAALNLFPGSLDYGTLTAGQQATLQVAVSNLGPRTLNWQVSTGSANWLLISQTKGAIKSGGLPQTLFVTANTISLSGGNQTASLRFSSNGGNLSLSATLAVSASPPSPTPTASTNPPAISVYPSSLNANNDCSYTQGVGWICLEEIINNSAYQGNLNWKPSGSGLPGISFYPSYGSVSPNSYDYVYIYIPDTTCPANATLTFTGPVNAASVTWTCPPPPQPPVLTVNTTSLDPTQCYSSDGGNTYECQVTLGETPDSQGDANWYVYGDYNEYFDPSGNILTPGGSEQVTIYDIPCQNDTFTFGGYEGEQQVYVNWLCSSTSPVPSPSPDPTGTPPVLTVNTTSLDPTQCNSSDGGNTYECQVTLGETPDSQGNANWYVYGNLGESFDPSSDTLSPGGSEQVTIDNIPCQNDTITFAGNEGEQPVYVQWSCEATPTPTPTPSPTPSPTSTPPPVFTLSTTSLDPSQCSSSDGGNTYDCTVYIGETSDSQGQASWSASSDMGASFDPDQGYLSPGGSEQVSVYGLPCQDGTITFSGNEGEQSVSVQWSCSPTPTSSSDPTPTPTSGS